MKESAAVIDALTADRELVFRFFAFFSRFEYSLKRSGFLTGEKAKPNWDCYAESLRGKFDVVPDGAFQAAVAFLLAAPPRTQIVNGTDLGWKDTVQGDGEHKERYVLRLVSTVRNNLFHGGKYPYPFGPTDDTARNHQLLEAALSVLKHCLELNDGVWAAFHETA